MSIAVTPHVGDGPSSCDVCRTRGLSELMNGQRYWVTFQIPHAVQVRLCPLHLRELLRCCDDALDSYYNVAQGARVSPME